MNSQLSANRLFGVNSKQKSSMPQHRQINFSSLRKCSLPFFPTVFETTGGSLQSASGSLSDPRVSGSPSLV